MIARGVTPSTASVNNRKLTLMPFLFYIFLLLVLPTGADYARLGRTFARLSGGLMLADNFLFILIIEIMRICSWHSCCLLPWLCFMKKHHPFTMRTNKECLLLPNTPCYISLEGRISGFLNHRGRDVRRPLSEMWLGRPR